MGIGISHGSNNKQVGPVGCCDVVCWHDAAFLSTIFIQGAYEHTPQLLSEIMNLNAVSNYDSQDASAFCHCLPLK